VPVCIRRFHSRPHNVFDAGVGGVALLFRINVALLVALKIAGLWGAARLIRSAWRQQRDPGSTQPTATKR